jgi:orotidine-5'-phosphate decarboxylase
LRQPHRALRPDLGIRTFRGVTRAPYLERLAARSAATGTVLCLGIDPDPRALPRGMPAILGSIEEFALMLVRAASPFAAGVKANSGFFEAYGSAGIAVLERVRAAVPRDVPFILDAKRGDIGSTSERYATAAFDALDADAITVSPYLGPDAIAPLLDRPDRLVYLLCRTSNPGAGTLQGLRVAADPKNDAPEETLALRVARLAGGWATHPGTIGLVAGATAPAELAEIRAVSPGLPFLIPGVGSQGGDADAAILHGPAQAEPAGSRRGGGLLVNVSRGIASAAVDADDPEAAIAESAKRWSASLRC